MFKRAYELYLETPLETLVEKNWVHKVGRDTSKVEYYGYEHFIYFCGMKNDLYKHFFFIIFENEFRESHINQNSDYILKYIETINKKLNSDKFMANAKKEVVEMEQLKKKVLETIIDEKNENNKSKM